MTRKNLLGKNLLAGLLLLALAGCAAGGSAAPYQPFANGIGYHEEQTGPDTWMVYFTGTDATSAETLQTYWLYRSAKLTIEKSYDGFVTTQGVQFVRKGEAAPRILLAMAGHPGAVVTPIFVGGGVRTVARTNLPGLAIEIKLLKAPVTTPPPTGFDARKLIAQLDPIMAQPRCDRGNICPHDHIYLRGS